VTEDDRYKTITLVLRVVTLYVLILIWVTTCSTKSNLDAIRKAVETQHPNDPTPIEALYEIDKRAGYR
jgi:HAMP domain-containing protein